MNNSKELIIITVFTVLVFAGIIGLASLKNSSGPSVNATASDIAQQSPLVAEQTRYDFGTNSMARGKVKNEYAVKNTSASDVTLKKIYTSCMCTEASLIFGDRRVGPFGMAGHGVIPSINEKIPAGAEFSVETVFDPAAHGPAGVGPIQRVVFLETSQGMTELEFSAVVEP